MEIYLLPLLEKGGFAGALVVGVVLMLGVFLRQKGSISIGDETRVVKTHRLDAIDQKLGRIDARLGEVEVDLDNRPTRKEMHDLDKAVTRLDERMEGLGKITSQTNAGVARLEDFMINASTKKG